MGGKVNFSVLTFSGMTTIVLIQKYYVTCSRGYLVMTLDDQNRFYDLDIYTHFNMLRGEVQCPIGQRLLDMFNGVGFSGHIDRGDFLEFCNIYDPGNNKTRPECYKSYIKKDSIQALAVSSTNLGRGMGAKSEWKTFPFVNKTQASVSLQLHSYWLSGSIHLSQGQSTQDLLNEDKQFMPLTQSSIGLDQRIIDTSPFVMVNKNYIIGLREN
jgi:hypothetical protein